MENEVRAIFDQLSRWRNLPNYQIERRTDIFFSLYLPALLMNKDGAMLDPIIIPEFPIKRDLVCPSYKTNRSIKIDYVAFGNNATVYYIELKTDVNSRRAAQDDYMEICHKIGFTTIFNGLKDIFAATKSKHKYYYLFEHLQAADVVKLPNGLKEAIACNSIETSNFIRSITLNKEFPFSKIVYVQPQKEKDTANKLYIGFEDIVESLKGRGDGLSRVFSEYLVKWQSAAGLSKE